MVEWGVRGSVYRPVTLNLVPPKSCPAWALIEYKLYTVEALGLGFSIDETIGGQLTAGDHSRHYRPTKNNTGGHGSPKSSRQILYHMSCVITFMGLHPVLTGCLI